MHFYVTSHGPAIRANREQSVEKIRTSFQIPMSGILNGDFLAVSRSECFRAQTVVEPDALEMSLAVREIALITGFSHRAMNYRGGLEIRVPFRMAETAGDRTVACRLLST